MVFLTLGVRVKGYRRGFWRREKVFKGLKRVFWRGEERVKNGIFER
jgi:hypothetical protein